MTTSSPDLSIDGFEPQRADTSSNRKLAVAIILLKRGSPLPVDLQADLLSQGIDVSALEMEHAQ